MLPYMFVEGDVPDKIHIVQVKFNHLFVLPGRKSVAPCKWLSIACFISPLLLPLPNLLCTQLESLRAASSIRIAAWPVSADWRQMRTAPSPCRATTVLCVSKSTPKAPLSASRRYLSLLKCKSAVKRCTNGCQPFLGPLQEMNASTSFELRVESKAPAAKATAEGDETDEKGAPDLIFLRSCESSQGHIQASAFFFPAHLKLVPFGDLVDEPDDADLDEEFGDILKLRKEERR